MVGRKGRVEYLAFQAPGQGTGIRYRGENPEALKRANLRCGGEGFGGKGGGGAASGVEVVGESGGEGGGGKGGGDGGRQSGGVGGGD